MAFSDIWKSLASAPEPEPEPVAPSSAYKARSALSVLYASDYGYDEWHKIGIAFKAAGGELADWLAWCAIDAANYNEKTARDLFNNVDADGPITANTLWALAWANGWEWHERYERFSPVREVPKALDIDDGADMAVIQLESMFEPGDIVNIVSKSTKNDKGKWVPSGYGKMYERDALIADIRARGLYDAIGGYRADAGAWLRVNPMDGNGIADDNVKVCRNALVESDDMPIKEQERLLFELGLPIACVTDSGGKSLHAIVRIDADGRTHYADRVRYMHSECERAGMTIDKANRNPGRLTRLAGCERAGRVQRLMHTRIGARDFTSWMLADKAVKMNFDNGIEPMDMETPPVLDQVLIDGVMRRGDKMCVAGPSKAYKSFALIQLAIACACGIEWLGWKVTQGRVLYINCELRGESFRKRVWEVAKAMDGAEPAAIAANMDVWSMRGRAQPLKVSKDRIIEQAGERGYDMVILDPIYKLFDGDENSAEEVSSFMLYMDELAMRLRASIVYCHHHSKGAKGGVSAQDRFSGSGVFARDCDELIDVSPLDLKDHDVGEWGYAPGASAWRIETVLRDFAPKYPLDVVFEYPVHHVDETGYLSGFKILSVQAVGGSRSGEKRREERDANIAEMERYIARECAKGAGAVSLTELSDHFGKSKRTISGWAERTRKVTAEKLGKEVFYKPATVETN